MYAARITHISRAFFVLAFLDVVLVSAFDMNQCANDVFSNASLSSLWLDIHGNSTPNQTLAKAMSYQTCLQQCGGGTQGLDWNTFSQQFSAWLLPWLALVSQLPFGAQHQWDNVASVALTIGSPALAAYSLSITLINRYFLRKATEDIHYPNAKYIPKVLAALQYIPFTLILDDPSLLSSLLVLPENDAWWRYMAEATSQTRTWNIPAVSNVVWVVIALLFTVIDSFADFTTFINSPGYPVGAAWLAMLPIMTGWLRVGSQTDTGQLKKALEEANSEAYVALEDTDKPRQANERSGVRALIYGQPCRGHVRCDEDRTTPLHNYARVFLWAQWTEHILDKCRTVAEKVRDSQTVSGEPWTTMTKWEDGIVHPNNRRGTADQVVSYTNRPSERARALRLVHPASSLFAPRVSHRWAPGIFERVAIASAIALALQWSTTGAAVFINHQMPTVGFGCRSASLVLYGVLATVSFLLHLASSILGHALRQDESAPFFHNQSTAGTILHVVTILCRWLGKWMAIVNCLWLILTCLFQFTNRYNNCFCLSDALTLGNRGFVSFPDAGDLVELGTKTFWIWGVVFSSIGVVLFLIFVYLVTSNKGE